MTDLYPANILDLRSWKLTLPTGAPLAPTEIKQPALSTYTDANFLKFGTSVLFRAGVDGFNQPGSKYPRCELREMTPDGKSGASWSPAVGRHTMTITQRILSLPTKKPEIVAGQIHDAAGFVLLIWVRGLGNDGRAEVIARRPGQDVVLVPEIFLNASLLQIHIEAANGEITCGDFKMPWTAGGCYFKAGCYTQSNLTTVVGEDPNSYGEVRIHSLAVTHT